jgi:hypothetical protein
MTVSLTEDCASCAALCCLALAFDRGESFAIDKPAGVPCPNLSPVGHGCSIHDRLHREGFSGCVRYSCTGAGQRVVQELFAGRSWRDDPALVAPMMQAFRGMRAMQERLVILTAAKNLKLSEVDAARCEALMSQLMPGEIDRQEVADFPGSALQSEIDTFVSGLRSYVTG